MTTIDQKTLDDLCGGHCIGSIPVAMLTQSIALQGLQRLKEQLGARVDETQEQMDHFVDRETITAIDCKKLIALCAEARAQLRDTHSTVGMMGAKPAPQHLQDTLDATIVLASKAARHLALLAEVCEKIIHPERLAIHDDAIEAVQDFVTSYLFVQISFLCFVEDVVEGRKQASQPSAQEAEAPGACGEEGNEGGTRS